MKLLKNFIFIALMGMTMGACDWNSDPLELVYPGTDLSGNKEDNKESELIKDVEQVLTTSSDEVWKIIKEDVTVYIFFNVGEGKYQMKSTENPKLFSSEYKTSVNENENVVLSFVGSDLKTILGDENFEVTNAKVSSVTCKGVESGTEYVWKRADRSEMDALMTEDEKVEALLASVEQGGGWKIDLDVNACYFIFDVEQKTAITKSEREPQNVSGAYSLTLNNEGKVELTLVQSHFEALTQESVLVVTSYDENSITCQGKSNGTSYTMTKVTKAEMDNIKTPEQQLIEKMFEIGWGSGVIRSASDGNFVAYYYLTKDDHTVHFLSYANQTVTRKNVVATVVEEDVLTLQETVTVGSDMLSAIKLKDNGVELTGLTAANKLVENLSYQRDKQTVKKMSEWIKLGYPDMPQFKEERCIVSTDLTEELNKMGVFEWNGDWNSIVILYENNYYYMLFQSNNMTPLEGVDVIRFDKSKGLRQDDWIGGRDLSVITSNFKKMYGFLFDEDHIIVRSNEAPEAGLYVFSISSDNFIYWPKPVF